MPKKYYAVKKGFNPGIYETWDDCKKQVDGFSGASFKSFKNLYEAQKFLCNNEKKNNVNVLERLNIKKSDAVAYVDGSYDDSIKMFAYGVVLFYNKTEMHFSGKMHDCDLLEMRNVAGEIKAAEKAMKFCIENKINSVDLYYDYEGIAKWCTGEWKANKKGTKDYKKFYDNIKSNLYVNFVKVKGHSGDKYNDLADKLAKDALFK